MPTDQTRQRLYELVLGIEVAVDDFLGAHDADLSGATFDDLVALTQDLERRVDALRSAVIKGFRPLTAKRKEPTG